MYENLKAPVPDRIIMLMQAFRNDPRPEKMNLGIGVYKDEHGASPVFKAIKAAEAILIESEETKAYIGLTGDEGFSLAMADLTLGASVGRDRLRAAQTPGGAGALRLFAELIREASPTATVWITDPTWINHHPIMTIVGLENRPLPYFDRSTHSVDFDAMMETLKKAARGDVALLHGCCHNPSGADLTMDQWKDFGRLCNERGLIPLIDIAYQGLGDGIEEDAAGIQHLAQHLPEMFVTTSCSKNFGVYRDRVGCAMLLSDNRQAADVAMANMAHLARVNYSFPPNHGAAAVRLVLERPELKALWADELTSMRTRTQANRNALADALREDLSSDRFEFIREQRGMFSLMGLDVEQIDQLQDRHAIFMPADARLNFAALLDHQIPVLSKAIASVIQQH